MIAAAVAMIGGLFLSLSGYGELGFYLVLFGGGWLSGRCDTRLKSSCPLANSPRETEPKAIPSTVPTACGHPEPRTRCSDCYGELLETADAFFHLGWRTRVHLCQVPRHMADSSVKSGDLRNPALGSFTECSAFRIPPQQVPVESRQAGLRAVNC